MRRHRCGLRERSWAFVLLALGSLAAFFAAPSLADVQYTYDMAGRISQAIYSDGSLVEYRYDANGNIIAINRLNASTLSIATFSPVIGQANTVVAILGSGFSPTASENTVTFGSTIAVASSATASELVVTVPQGASTGPITVTVGSNSAQSTQAFTVRKPLITGFSPSLANIGAAITINGNYFNIVPTTTITAGGTAASINSLGDTQIVFAAPATGTGKIQVQTSASRVSSMTSSQAPATTTPEITIPPSGATWRATRSGCVVD